MCCYGHKHHSAQTDLQEGTHQEGDSVEDVTLDVVKQHAEWLPSFAPPIAE